MTIVGPITLITHWDKEAPMYYQVRWTRPHGESGLSGGYRSLAEAEASAASERRAGRKATVICWRCRDTEDWCPADWRA